MAIYGGLRVDSSALSGESVTRGFKIAKNEGDDIFQGDLVVMEAAGSVTAASGVGEIAAVGVFVGCEYTNSDGERVFDNHYVDAINRDDNIALVNVNPLQFFKIRVGTGGTEGTITQAAIGMGFDIDYTNAGNTTTGLSGMMLDTATAATTAQLRVVAVTNDDGADYLKEAAATTYTHAIVFVDPAVHFFNASVGI